MGEENNTSCTPSDDVVERVAQTIYAHYPLHESFTGRPISWDEAPDKAKNAARYAARAVLESEPIRGMIETEAEKVDG